MASREFEYTALDQSAASTRVLKIHDDFSPEGFLQCSLHDIVLDSRADYTCLSYVWGTDDPTHTILINGRPLRVRSNLKDFLECAQRKPRLRATRLWIDAICIDQSNMQERSTQVQQMGRIYSEASEVVSWFGKVPINLDFFGPQPGLQWDSMGMVYNPELTRAEKKDVQSSFYAFRSTGYWTRAWITQEVALPSRLTLMADEKELDWEQMDSNLRYMLTLATCTQRQKGALDLPTRKRDLLHHLGEQRSKGCKIPRDRIFSVLELSEYGSQIKVDYEATDESLLLDIFKIHPYRLCLCTFGLVLAATFDRQAEFGNTQIPLRYARLYNNRSSTRSFISEERIGAQLEIFIQLNAICSGPDLQLKIIKTDQSSEFSWTLLQDIHLSPVGIAVSRQGRRGRRQRKAGCVIRRASDDTIVAVDIALDFLVEILGDLDLGTQLCDLSKRASGEQARHFCLVDEAGEKLH